MRQRARACATEISITPKTQIAIAVMCSARHRLAEENQAEQRRLRRLGARIGGADREIAEGEQMDQQGGRDDLRHPADHRPEKELPVRRPAAAIEDAVEDDDEEQRKGRP